MIFTCSRLTATPWRAALHQRVSYREQGVELACVCVDSRYENQGIGAKLMQYTESVARAKGVAELFCLSTQAFNYFQQKGGFTPERRPTCRRRAASATRRRRAVTFAGAEETARVARLVGRICRIRRL